MITLISLIGGLNLKKKVHCLLSKLLFELSKNVGMDTEYGQ